MSAKRLVEIAADLRNKVDTLRFREPVACVYNPLRYAWDIHEKYLQRFGKGSKEILLVGMNPGPFGMTQTGIPFGDVEYVRQWLGLNGEICAPAVQHPRRPVLGFSSTRREMSGQRMWGWVQSRFGAPEIFFKRFFIWSYCPLCFLGKTGSNITPDKLAAADRPALYKVCDEALAQVIAALRPGFLVGIGNFAEKRVRSLDIPASTVVGRILHPSPASPKANANWAGTIESELNALGISL